MKSEIITVSWGAVYGDDWPYSDAFALAEKFRANYPWIKSWAATSGHQDK